MVAGLASYVRAFLPEVTDCIDVLKSPAEYLLNNQCLPQNQSIGDVADRIAECVRAGGEVSGGISVKEIEDLCQQVRASTFN
jgi:hypothetical protein